MNLHPIPEGYGERGRTSGSASRADCGNFRFKMIGMDHGGSNMIRRLFGFAVCTGALLLVPVHARAQEQEELLTFGVLGWAAGTDYYAVMRSRVVQKLLLDVAGAPRTAKFVDGALKGTGLDRRQLQELGLVRQRDSRMSSTSRSSRRLTCGRCGRWPNRDSMSRPCPRIRPRQRDYHPAGGAVTFRGKRSEAATDTPRTAPTTPSETAMGTG